MALLHFEAPVLAIANLAAFNKLIHKECCLVRAVARMLRCLWPMDSRKSPRKILLAVREGCLDARLLASARSLCQRMDAELDILVRTGKDTLSAELEDFIRELREAGLPYSLTQKPEMRRRDIVEYANNHECISSVIIDSLEGWETVAADRASDPWARLACPLVTAAPARKPGASNNP
jgi:hypothetical protein